MSTPARSGGRRRWVLVAAGLGVAGLILVTAVLSLSSRDSAAIDALTPVTPSTGDAMVSVSRKSISVSSSVLLPESRPDSTLVGGQTDHLVFARLVAQALLGYDPSTDFNARNQDLLFAAAPAPYGDEARLAQDLASLTPSGPAQDSMRRNRTTGRWT